MHELIGFALLGVTIFITLSTRIRFGVMRLRSDGTMISDVGGKLVSVWWDRIWLAQFSEEWWTKYGSTYAFGYGRDKVWFYTPAWISEQP